VDPAHGDATNKPVELRTDLDGCAPESGKTAAPRPVVNWPFSNNHGYGLVYLESDHRYSPLYLEGDVRYEFQSSYELHPDRRD